jgi:hypothetical protein
MIRLTSAPSSKDCRCNPSLHAAVRMIFHYNYLKKASGKI